MSNEKQDRRLDSWKEIADYLGRDVRTAVRWEKDKGLPVRRLPGGKRQSVFAFTAEIDAWLLQQNEPSEGNTLEPSTPVASNAPADEFHTDTKAAAPSSKLMILGVGALTFLAVVGWFLNTRINQPAAAPVAAEPPREVNFATPTGALHFVRSEIETGLQAYRLVAADLNRDGTLDIVYSTETGDVVGILMGKGDGSFLPAQLYERCPGSESVVAADYNRDGHPDIAVTCSAGDSVVVLWGKGDGTFPERTDIRVPGGPRFLASGDLNEDGWPDLVVSCYSEPALFVLINHSGRFSSTRISSFEAASSVAISDLNGDGHADLVASVRVQGKYGLGLFWGKGDSSFRLMHMLEWEDTSRMATWVVHAVDINGDGLKDLVFSLWNQRLVVSRGMGRGEFSRPAALGDMEASAGQRSFDVADLDLDGKLDVLVSNNRSGTLMLFRGNGDGTFSPGVSAPLQAGMIYFPTVADFNKDGLPDILVNVYFEKRAALLKADWKRDANR